jgi:branched-chain amino acid transport system permease protein
MNRWKKPAAALVFLLVLIAIPQVLDRSYYLHLRILIMMNAVLAMSFIMLWRTGLLNLSIAGFWGIGAYSYAMLTTKAGLSFWLALPGSVAIGAAIAALLGLLICRRGGIAFIIPSLAFGFIVPLVFGSFEFFGKYIGLYGLKAPDPIGAIHFESKASFYYLLLALSIVIIVIALGLYRGWTGRAWQAIGLSPRLSGSLGYSVFKYRLLCFIIASGIAVAMGVFYASYSVNISPAAYGPLKCINVQMYALLGGLGFPIMGPVVGSTVLTIAPEVFRMSGEYEAILTGTVIILIAMYLPQGLLGHANLFIKRRREGTRAAKSRSDRETSLREEPPAVQGSAVADGSPTVEAQGGEVAP